MLIKVIINKDRIFDVVLFYNVYLSMSASILDQSSTRYVKHAPCPRSNYSTHWESHRSQQYRFRTFIDATMAKKRNGLIHQVISVNYVTYFEYKVIHICSLISIFLCILCELSIETNFVEYLDFQKD